MSKVLKIVVFVTLLATIIGGATYFLLSNGPTLTLEMKDLEGGNCNDNQTCNFRDPNSFCNLPPDNSTVSTCQCKTGYVISYDRKRCIKTNSVRLGEPCQETRQCVNWNKSFSRVVCVYESGYCDCFKGYAPSDDLTRCLPVVNRLEWESCKEDGQCQLGTPGPLSKCVKEENSYVNETRGTCKCQNGSVNAYGEHECHPIAMHINSPCEINAQCTVGLGHSRCVDNKCICNPGYAVPYQVNGTRFCVKSHPSFPNPTPQTTHRGRKHK